jgi:uncharacterized protein (DUF2267 family)
VTKAEFLDKVAADDRIGSKKAATDAVDAVLDAILAQVAPNDIAAVSSWSHDTESASAPLDWARAHPALGVTAEEIIAAYKREGAAVTKRDNVHRMADANKAFAHFAW